MVFGSDAFLQRAGRPKDPKADEAARARARASARNQQGVSLCRDHKTSPETEHNCVAVRRGGEQWKVNDRSVG